MMGTSRYRLAVVQLVAAIAFLPLGWVVISSYAAVSPHEDPRVPASWPAGVPNHGEYYRWPLGTIHDSPVLFALSVALLLLCWLFLIISGIRASLGATSK